MIRPYFEMIVFLAHWCSFCQNEVPWVSQWLQDTELPSIVEAVPGASPELVTRWLERDGERRRIFDERFMFGHSYDMHVSAFWHQLLVG